MGRIKEQLINDMNQVGIDKDYDYAYWLESPEFVEYVNAEIDSTRPRYSENDVMSATRYASSHITIEPQEVGKEVYDMLFSEKIEEYLTTKTDVWISNNI